MRILIAGAQGQVARALLERAQGRSGFDVVALGRPQLDLLDKASIARAIDAVRPDLVVNAAAYTAVDKAEEEIELAMMVNARAPGALADAARRHNALLVHYSTDYVFDGTKSGTYSETDAPNPASAYGRSKLAGEEAIRAAGADHLIFRTSWVFAARGKNFLRTILRLAGEREELRIVADQSGAPTWARLIAEVTALALGQELARRKNGGFESGTFNLTAAGETSWHGFASAIIAAARARGAKLTCRTVVPITTTEYPLPAARPANSRLAGDKLAEHYGLALPEWEDCMQLCLAELFPT